MRILVTGGCGFIGSHLTDLLIEQGHKVRVYDLLEKQVHRGQKPGFLNKNVNKNMTNVIDTNSLFMVKYREILALFSLISFFDKANLSSIKKVVKKISKMKEVR